jgi:hypothetical protein
MSINSTGTTPSATDGPWWIAKCSNCYEESLSGRSSGPCPFCDAAGQVTYRPDTTPRNTVAQDEVCAALWEFAAANANPAKHTTRRSSDGVGVNGEAIQAALKRIMAAFGCVVTSDL